jgi:hypothetical protein
MASESKEQIGSVFENAASEQQQNSMFQCNFKCIMIVEHYLTAYPAVYGQFPQAIPQPIAAVPAQREGKKSKH